MWLSTSGIPAEQVQRSRSRDMDLRCHARHHRSYRLVDGRRSPDLARARSCGRAYAAWNSWRHPIISYWPRLMVVIGPIVCDYVRVSSELAFTPTKGERNLTMSALRMLFLSIAGITLIGIALTGFHQASWVLYLPVVFLSFAGITGICPGLILWSKLGFKNESLSCELPRRKP